MTIVDITHESPRVDGPAEHSMLFSPPMVRALLAEIARPGTGKTQTRRIVSASNSEVLGHRYRATSPAWAGLDFTRAEARTRSTMMLAIAGKDAPFDLHLSVPWKHPDDPPGWEATYRVRPVWEVGDRIVVREPIEILGTTPTGAGYPDSCLVRYRSTPENPARWFYDCDIPGVSFYGLKIGPRAAMFMPRWAARIILTVTEVRVQRLQDITKADAKAEGIESFPAHYPAPYDSDGYIAGFAELWNRINDKRSGCSWADSPWVWAITFQPSLIAPGDPAVGPAASASPVDGQQGRDEGR